MQAVLPEDVASVAEWFVHVLDYPADTPMPAPAALARWLTDADGVAAARERVVYCGLFDIGNPEPPVPLLESHYHQDPMARLRRVVNFYRTYGVVQEANRAPDHLCVELAFLAYLARVAMMYPARADVIEALRAFARLHPGSFSAQCVRALARHDTGGVYRNLFEAMDRFLADVGGERVIPLAPDRQPGDAVRCA